METLLRDLRVGLRQLIADKGFSTAAILTLALGIGAIAAVLTVAHALLFQQLPYRDPQRLVMLEGTMEQGGQVQPSVVSHLDFDDWRQRSSVFSQMALFGSLAYNLEEGQQSQRLWGELVTAQYLSVLGLQPALGRFISADEDARPFEQYVVVLGYDLWRTAFAADTSVLGRIVHLNGKPYRVVGVGPPGFRGLGDQADLWLPSMVPPDPDFLRLRRMRWATVVARLKPGMSIPQARQQMRAVTGALAREMPVDDQGVGVAVSSLEDYWFGKLKAGLLVLTIGACTILFIACINVGSLLLTRAAARQRAYGIRIALGASRSRLARQLLTESVLLSLIGAAAGLLLGHWLLQALVAASGVRFPSFVHVSLQPGVVAVIVAVAVLCGLTFGMAPLWVSFRADVKRTLSREEGPPAGGKPALGFRRFQNAIVVAQVALALTLSVDAGLMTASFRRFIQQDLGFRPDNLLTYRIDLRGPKYVSIPTVTGLLSRVYVPRIAALPGVQQLELTDPTLPSDDLVEDYYSVEDHDSESPDGTYIGKMHAVTPGYFHLMGIPLIKGRGFDMQDTQSNVTVVSKELADRQWPGKDPLGKRLKLDQPRSGMKPWLTVVGVVGDVRYEGIQAEREPTPDIYLSLLQYIRRPPLTVNFVIRPRPGSAVPELRSALHREMMAIDPELPDYDAATMAARLARQTDKARFQVALIGAFSLLSLVLAAVGVYGVIAYGVEQRRREIAIRVSLGADRAGILRLVVGRGALVALLGVALGLAAVFACRRLLVPLLFETSIADPLILGGTCMALFLVSLFANYLPARRAAGANPMLGLRLQ